MSLKSRIIQRLGGIVPAEAPSSPVAHPRRGHLGKRIARAYKAAVSDRLVADWLSAGGDINQELKSQLAIIRSRAREAEQNSNLAQRYFGLCQTHIVGHEGFTLQVQGKNSAGDLDSATNKAIETEFRAWSRAGVCDSTGRHSFPALCRLGVRTAARDGETLWRLHDVQPDETNPWGFVVEPLDPARLDHLFNDDLKNGNRIRLGVELAPSGRPVAYWLKTGERAGMLSTRESHTRVPAGDIIHWFIQQRPEQLRGVSWLASGLLTLHQIDATQEAAIVACRAGASKMGFYTQEAGGAGPHVLADEQDDNGDLLSEFDPAHIGTLPAGVSFEGFDPRYPHEAYADFMKVFHRDLSVGLGVSYHALTGDLTDVNFSSIRSGTLEERESWKVLQDSFASMALRRIYSRWLSAAFMNGRFFAQRRNTTATQFLATYSEHRWQGRRWPWVDPVKDIEAIVNAINAKLTSPQRVASELGVDLEEILDDIAAYEKMLADRKLSAGPVVGEKAGEKVGDKAVESPSSSSSASDQPDEQTKQNGDADAKAA